MHDEDGDEDSFKIEDDVKMPPSKRMMMSKYPLARLKVGQSFFVPGTGNGRREVDGISSTIRATARRHEIAIETRVLTEKYKGKETRGVRVWRVADRHAKTAK